MVNYLLSLDTQQTLVSRFVWLWWLDVLSENIRSEAAR